MKKQSFNWRAVDEKGVLRHGLMLGSEAAEVQAHLRKEGYFPVGIRERKSWQEAFSILQANPPWHTFARRLAMLLEAGIPLLQALEVMTIPTGKDKKADFQQGLWKNIKSWVEEGRDLSEAMSYLNPAPNSFVLSMVKAGEYTGTLGKNLREAANELDQERATRKKMQSALIYPLLLFMAVVVVLYVLSVWVLPMYEKMFVDMGSDGGLPLLTEVIFAFGRKFPLFLWSGAGLTAAGVFAFKMAAPDLWRKRLQQIPKKIPLLGNVYRLRNLVQFCRMLGSLLAAGIPLLEALQLTAGIFKGSEFQEFLDQLAAGVRQGRPLAPFLRASGFFPPEGAEMIGIAEETGQLDRMLRHVAEIFQKELEDQLNRLTRLLEPALILIVGGLIGLVAAGVMLPVFDLSTQLQ